MGRRRPLGFAMGTRLYVGNLAYSTTEETLRDAFGADGRTVTNVFLVMDRETGRPRGFAFVELATEAEAKAAAAAMDGANLDGRALRVNEAQERSGGGGGAGPRRFNGPPSGDRGPPRVERYDRGPGGPGGDRGPPRDGPGGGARFDRGPGGPPREGPGGGGARFDRGPGGPPREGGGGYRGGGDRGGFGGGDRGGFGGGGGYRGAPPPPPADIPVVPEADRGARRERDRERDRERHERDDDAPPRGGRWR